MVIVGGKVLVCEVLLRVPGVPELIHKLNVDVVIGRDAKGCLFVANRLE